jgi:hypothetical protein
MIRSGFDFARSAGVSPSFTEFGYYIPAVTVPTI